MTIELKDLNDNPYVTGFYRDQSRTNYFFVKVTSDGGAVYKSYSDFLFFGSNREETLHKGLACTLVPIGNPRGVVKDLKDRANWMEGILNEQNGKLETEAQTS